MPQPHRTRVRLPLVCSLLLGAGLAQATTAQAPLVLDDFNGPRVDAGVWLSQGEKITQANSRLRFDMTAVPFEESYAGVAPWDGFRGHFDLLLEFDSFQPNLTRGRAGLELAVYDLNNPSQNFHGISIEISGNQAGRTFVTYEDRDGVLRSSQRTTTASAGALRLYRDAQGITAAYREASQTGWTTIHTWPNILTDLVEANLVTVCGSDGIHNQGALSVQCDRFRYGGPRVKGAVNYGTSCEDVLVHRHGMAYIGNSTFGLGFFSGMHLANAPLTLILGLRQQTVDLGPAGAPGCALHTELTFWIPAGTSDPYGDGLVPLPIPNNSNLVGIQFQGQIAARTNRNAFGYAMSNGVSVEVVRL